MRRFDRSLYSCAQCGSLALIEITPSCLRRPPKAEVADEKRLKPSRTIAGKYKSGELSGRAARLPDRLRPPATAPPEEPAYADWLWKNTEPALKPLPSNLRTEAIEGNAH